MKIPAPLTRLLGFSGISRILALDLVLTPLRACSSFPVQHRPRHPMTASLKERLGVVGCRTGLKQFWVVVAISQLFWPRWGRECLGNGRLCVIGNLVLVNHSQRIEGQEKTLIPRVSALTTQRNQGLSRKFFFV